MRLRMVVPWDGGVEAFGNSKYKEVIIPKGGSNCPENLEPMTAKQHWERHKQQGDFSRWGKKGAEAKRKR